MATINAIDPEAGMPVTILPVDPASNSADFLGLFAYMHPLHQTLDQALHTFEKVLNFAGYIPIVSTFSGSIRIAYGKAEVVGAIAAGALLAVKALCNTDAEKRARDFDYAAGVAVNYSIHGLANIGRGFVEAIPIINLSCLVYDLTGTRIQYPFEAV
ncbi:MAG: hypothetical protein AB7H48_05785 [Parachlamydiales bacterium]|nr:hypothetical protein [Verrucomicrobiota bacterium]